MHHDKPSFLTVSVSGINLKYRILRYFCAFFLEKRLMAAPVNLSCNQLKLGTVAPVSRHRDSGCADPGTRGG